MLQLWKRVQTKRWLLIIPFILAMMTVYLFDVYDTKMKLKRQINSHQIRNITFSGFSVHTPGCRIPDLDPFDEAVRGYYKKQSYFSCGEKRPLIQSNQTSLWVAHEALADYGVSDLTSLTCCYTPFWRKEARDTEARENADNEISFLSKCIEFVEETNIYHEFVRVNCTINHTDSYIDFHAFIIPKQSKFEKNLETTKGVSVMMIGVDGVSRLNFIRQMPKTISHLKKLKAIEFLGYNKVHDNTFPNLVPILSGYSVDQLQKICWTKDTLHFDHCPWIWKIFNDNGYLTAFGEDASWMGIFNYLKKGFLKKPTDYYLRPFMKLNEDQIGHSQEWNAKYCCGVRFCTEVLFDYALKFVRNMTMSQKKYWGFFWGGSLTHDYLNFRPNTDDIYYNLLNNLNQSRVLEKTVVFVLSDHGIRWGPIRETVQGRLEERLPFLYIILPKSFSDRYSTAVSNMHRNTRFLTTPFDVHETMKDLMDLQRVDGEAIRRRTFSETGGVGKSLFLPIFGNRTCSNAGIPQEWCTCHKSKSISKNSTEAIRAAKTLVDHINVLVGQYIQCAELSLKQIHSARVESSASKVSGKAKEQIMDYVVVITTEPGNGMFEATVRHKTDSDRINVLGYVSRINMYGSQSKCILDYRLRLYCYCI